MNILHNIRKIKRPYLLGGILGIFVLSVSIFFSTNNNTATWVTGTVEEGDVSQIISVSGSVDATKTADLSFPLSGTLASISVVEGSVVTTGTKLAILAHDDLIAEYNDAYAALLIAQADQTELITGLRPEERTIAHTKVEIAEENLARVIREQDEHVENAYRVLLSDDLEARPQDRNNRDGAPIITGTYTCEEEGTYILDTFNSRARSGYAYRLSGLESGTYTAYTETSAPFGNCGLSIQFASDTSYSNSRWFIEIPNIESNSYILNLNTYNLAIITKENAIGVARQDVELAKQDEILGIASPRLESLAREEARVLQAQARLQKINAQIQDHILTAPFEGTITHIELVPGEIVDTTPVITMISKDVFTITALVPEIDITRITQGQKAHVVFDARAEETLEATIIFISPLAREISGVSYFEATLMLDAPVDWLRGGLNADIDIILETHSNVLRIPKRFIIDTNGQHSVRIPDGEKAVSIPVTIKFTGNDGFVEIQGLHKGDTIIAP